jgi:hypothetical protein
VPAIGYEDVCGLDVPMNDAGSMGRLQRIGDLNGERHQCVQWEAVLNPMLQCRPFEMLHRDKGQVAVGSNLVNGADVGVIQ